VISLDQGYHGALISTVAISPYKYEGRGGFRPPKWSHKGPLRTIISITIIELTCKAKLID
jgi:4-aminobutyrate aminotransferase-like enzyme